MTTPGAGRASRDGVIIVIGVAAAAVLLLYLRAPFAPQRLWAEDGRDYLGDALRLGPVRSLGQDRQAGYYMLTSRLGGVLASVFPLRAAALIVWLWVAGVTAWLVATVFVSSRTWLRTWPARVVLALAIVLVPVLRVDAIANAANLQVTMVFASLIVLISRPRSRAERVNACTLLVATALTTTIATVLLPFALARVFRTRRFRWDALAVSWAVGVAVQWAAIAIGRPDPVVRDGAGLASIASRYWRAGLAENVVPFDVPAAVGALLGVAFIAVVLIAVRLAWKDGARERAVWLVAVPSFGLGLFVLTALVSGAQSRYMVTPVLTVIWALLVAAEVIAGRTAEACGWSETTVMMVVGALLVLTWLPRWTPSVERRSGPNWVDAVANARDECVGASPDTEVRIAISPQNPDRPDQWSVRVRCREL